MDELAGARGSLPAEREAQSTSPNGYLCDERTAVTEMYKSAVRIASPVTMAPPRKKLLSA